MQRVSISLRLITPSGAPVEVEAEMGKPCGIVYTYSAQQQRGLHSPLHHPSKRRARLKASRHTDGHTLRDPQGAARGWSLERKRAYRASSSGGFHGLRVYMPAPERVVDHPQNALNAP